MTSAGTIRATDRHIVLVAALAIAGVLLTWTSLVATAAAATCANDELRKGAGANLPECRAYEQVTPVAKGGWDVATPVGYGNAINAAGDALMLRAQGGFPGAPDGGGPFDPDVYYYARRDVGGWSTIPAHGRPTLESGTRSIYLVAQDLRRTVISPLYDAFLPDPEPASGFSNVYLHDNPTGQNTLLLSTIYEGSALGYSGSADLGHVGISSRTVAVDEPGVPDSSVMKAYDFSGGEMKLVSRQAGTDLPFSTESSIAGLASAGTAFLSSSRGAGAVSADGTKIFFETPVTGFDGPSSSSSLIYRRTGGAATELASPSRRAPADPLGPRKKVFVRATPDGDTVFFTSSELLTDDANTGPSRTGSDLYRYDMASDELLDISATPAGDGAHAEAMVGTSADGKRVYYIARGVVAPGGVEGEPNLYLWEDDGSGDGVTRFVATLNGTGDELNWTTIPNDKASYVTADGRYVQLLSRASLTGYPNAGTRQVYRYDAEAAGGAGELTCVSCPPGASTGDAQVPSGLGRQSRAMSEDGRYLLFDTTDAHVARDANGKRDVYSWHDGDVDLLSTGRSPGDSLAVGSSEDGSRAFLWTREQLVPQDVDGNTDIYVAAVGGGLDSQHAVPAPECLGDECQGPGLGAPGLQGPTSSGFSGPGDVSPGSRACASLARKAARARGEARRTARLAGRASGRRAKRLRARHRVAKKRYVRAQQNVRKCKRGSK